jgi:hypothetical protein
MPRPREDEGDDRRDLIEAMPSMSVLDRTFTGLSWFVILGLTNLLINPNGPVVARFDYFWAS